MIAPWSARRRAETAKKNARSAYESAIASYGQNLFESYGGNSWTAVKDLVRSALNESDPVRGAQDYRAAESQLALAYKDALWAKAQSLDFPQTRTALVKTLDLLLATDPLYPNAKSLLNKASFYDPSSWLKRAAPRGQQAGSQKFRSLLPAVQVEIVYVNALLGDWQQVEELSLLLHWYQYEHIIPALIELRASRGMPVDVERYISGFLSIGGNSQSEYTENFRSSCNFALFNGLLAKEPARAEQILQNGVEENPRFYDGLTRDRGYPALALAQWKTGNNAGYVQTIERMKHAYAAGIDLPARQFNRLFQTGIVQAQNGDQDGLKHTIASLVQSVKAREDGAMRAQGWAYLANLRAISRDNSGARQLLGLAESELQKNSDRDTLTLETTNELITLAWERIGDFPEVRKRIAHATLFVAKMEVRAGRMDHVIEIASALEDQRQPSGTRAKIYALAAKACLTNADHAGYENFLALLRHEIDLPYISRGQLYRPVFYLAYTRLKNPDALERVQKVLELFNLYRSDDDFPSLGGINDFAGQVGYLLAWADDWGQIVQDIGTLGDTNNIARGCLGVARAIYDRQKVDAPSFPNAIWTIPEFHSSKDEERDPVYKGTEYAISGGGPPKKD